MTTLLDVHWCVGDQRLGGRYFRDLRERGEQIHIKTVGRLTLLDDTTIDDVRDVVDGVWYVGKFQAPADVRNFLLSRRRWRPSRPARRDWTTRVHHLQRTIGQTTIDRSVGLVWYDDYELKKRLALGSKIDLSVVGVLIFAKDVTPDLVDDVFTRITLNGPVVASPPVRDAVARSRVRER